MRLIALALVAVVLALPPDWGAMAALVVVAPVAVLWSWGGA